MTDRVNIVKNFKDEEGNVMVAPRNIITNKIKVGKIGKQTSLGGIIPYMDGDEYDAGKKLANKEREYHMSKLQDKPFSQ